MEAKFINTANRACALLYSYIKDYNDGIWLLPVNVCPDVPLTFCLAGVTFEFVDISPTTLCIDENICINKVSERDKCYVGILFVRTYGYEYDTTEFFSVCKQKKRNLKIIDDRCLCMPTINPKMYGADMCLFSTGRCKQIDLGEGGFAIYKNKTNYCIDSELFFDGSDEEILYKQSYKTRQPLQQIPKGWLNLKDYTDINTYWIQITKLIGERIKHRNVLNTIYFDALPQNILFEPKFQDWRCHIRVPAELKDVILGRLFQNGLFASNHYHSANRLFDNQVFSNSDRLYNTTINLFNDMNYTEEMTIKTCEIITDVLKS